MRKTPTRKSVPPMAVRRSSRFRRASIRACRVSRCSDQCCYPDSDAPGASRGHPGRPASRDEAVPASIDIDSAAEFVCALRDTPRDVTLRSKTAGRRCDEYWSALCRRRTARHEPWAGSTQAQHAQSTLATARRGGERSESRCASCSSSLRDASELVGGSGAALSYRPCCQMRVRRASSSRPSTGLAVRAARARLLACIAGPHPHDHALTGDGRAIAHSRVNPVSTLTDGRGPAVCSTDRVTLRSSVSRAADSVGARSMPIRETSDRRRAADALRYAGWPRRA